MKAIIKQIEGSSFACKSDSNHWVTIDSSPEDGGSGAGSSPMEIVLMGLGCCSAIDILLMLKKMRADVKDFQINIEAERAEEHPRVFTKVNLEYTLSGENIKPKDVERAIKLSMEKYCSVAGMVGKTAEIETNYQINN